MRQFLKLIMLCLTLSFVFSCSVGAGGGSSAPSAISSEITTPSTPSPSAPSTPDSRTPATPKLPPASTFASVKVLQIDAEKFQCGENFSSYLKNNKVGIKVRFGEGRTFIADVNFYDSSCSNLQAVGNKIAKYTVGGDYAVTTMSGTTILTINNSTLTIYGGDFPTSAKSLVDWINSCENVGGIFSSSTNTTVSFSSGPDCKSTPEQRFPFPLVGTTVESTENDIKKFIGLVPN